MPEYIERTSRTVTNKGYEVKTGFHGDKYWIKDGKLHREDGPAIEYPDGTKSYYLNNKELTEEEFQKKVRHD